MKLILRGFIKVVFRNLFAGTGKRKRNISLRIVNDQDGNRNKDHKIQVERHAVHSILSVDFITGLYIYIYIYNLLWSLYKPRPIFFFRV
jgi:hypothetical protein